MIEKWVFALCSALLFAVLAAGVIFTGPPVSRALIVLALALGGTGQYIAQDYLLRSQRIASLLMFLALFCMGAGSAYYILWTFQP